MRDLTSNIQLKNVLAPAVVTDNTAQVGAIIDGRGYDSVTYLINLGTLSDADATATVLLEEGDNSALSDAAAVADADMVSQTSGTAPETAAAFNYGDDGEVRKLGYIGSKRYTRITVTPSGNTGNIPISIQAILGHPGNAPVSQAAS